MPRTDAFDVMGGIESQQQALVNKLMGTQFNSGAIYNPLIRSLQSNQATQMRAAGTRAGR